jgi:hypothetical protein
VVWIPSTTNVFPFLGGNNQSGYCVLWKVQIKRFNRVPSTIELVRKTLKTDDKQKPHKQQLVGALACLCEHPNVIKFLTIPHRNHGSIHIVVEWGNFLKNVGLQHEVLSHY